MAWPLLLQCCGIEVCVGTNEEYMQTNPLQMLLGNPGSPTGIQSIGGQNGNGSSGGFEGILQGLLSATNHTAQTLPGQLTGLAGGNGLDISSTDTMQALNVVMKKIAAALANGKGGLNQADLAELLQDTLTAEDLQLLQALFPNMDQDELAQMFIDSAGQEQDQQLSLIEMLLGSKSIEELQGQEANELLKGLEDLITSLNSIIQTLEGLRAEQLALTGANGATGRTSPLQDILARFTELRNALQQTYADISGTPFKEAVVTELATAKENAPVVTNNTNPNGQQVTEGQGLTKEEQALQALQNGEKNIEGMLKKTVSEQNTASNDGNKDTRTINELLASFKQNSNGAGENSSFMNNNPSLFGQNQNGQGQVNPYLLNNMNSQAAFADIMQNMAGAETTEKQIPLQSLDAQLFEQLVVKDAAGPKTVDNVNLFQNVVTSTETNPEVLKSEHTGLLSKTSEKLPVNSNYLLDQISGKINAALKNGENRVSMQLHPPELGKINIELSMKDNQLRAVVIAETVQVKQVLESNIEQLRNTLEVQNIEVEKFSVHVGQDGKQFASLLRENNQGKGNKQTGEGDSEQGEGGVPSTHEILQAAMYNQIIENDRLDLLA